AARAAGVFLSSAVAAAAVAAVMMVRRVGVILLSVFMIVSSVRPGRACLSADMTPKGNTNLWRRWLKGSPPSCQRNQRQVSISLGSEAGQGVDHGRGDHRDRRRAAAGGGIGAGDDVHVDRYW